MEPATEARPDGDLLKVAVALLARREFARVELGRRLLRRAGAAKGAAEAVERVLDHVQAKGLLSEERFTQEFIRARAGRFGPARLRHELLSRGLDKERVESAIRSLQGDEFGRAYALWQRRFDAPPADARERARQGRFLAARGFSHDVIRRILEGRPC